MNDTGKRISSAKARKSPHLLAPLKIGYFDAMNGAPYTAEYETAKQWWQHNYNQGRLIAAEFKADGIMVKWPPNTILPKIIQDKSKLVARTLRRMADGDC
jgi:hypothetical protein